MMKFYIAGPVSGQPNHNVETFKSVADQITDSGNAALYTSLLPKGMSEPEYMKFAHAMLEVCDVVVLLPNLVLSILESANCGPTTIDSMLLWDKETEEAGRAHLEFVVEQLLVSGCMTYTGDKRLITTQKGELHIRLITQHVA